MVVRVALGAGRRRIAGLVLGDGAGVVVEAPDPEGSPYGTSNSKRTRIKDNSGAVFGISPDRDAMIVGNTIEDCFRGVAIVHGRVTITGNRFRGNELAIGGGTTVSVTSNQFLGNGHSLDHPPRGYTIVGNHFEDAGLVAAEPCSEGIQPRPEAGTCARSRWSSSVWPRLRRDSRRWSPE